VVAAMTLLQLKLPGNFGWVDKIIGTNVWSFGATFTFVDVVFFPQTYTTSIPKVSILLMSISESVTQDIPR
jgi:hypothetical protein